MYRYILMTGIVLSLGVNVMADYLAGRKAALALAQAGKYQEAVSAFSNLAAEARSDFQKSDALEQAACWACVLKQFDQALVFAQQIPIPAASKNCRMKILCNAGKSKELIAEFKDEKIEEWPESLVGAGLASRGTAYYTLKEGTSAAADLGKAADYMTDDREKAAVFLTLGDNWRNNLNDDSKALEAYTRIIALKLGTSCVPLTAILASTEILCKRGKYDEALQILNTVNIAQMSGCWLGSFLYAHAEILAGQGRKTEAIAKLNEAAAAKDIFPEQKNMFEKRLKALQSDAR